jgi:class 3 adenylate cyclase
MANEPDSPAAPVLIRKLATILSADVAEFSRLMAEDEEQTLLTFRSHARVFEQLVAMHRGRIFNTAGDAILAEFASAVEAVRCATEIQAALQTRNSQLPASRQVRFRIGVNLGDVMVQGTDLLGDGVNVAARLQTAAQPGGICLSGSVYDQIRNKLSLSFKSLGEKTFKNIPQPVRTFSITEADGQGSLPSPKAARRRWIATAAWLAMLALLLAAIGFYWAYSQDRPGKAQQARSPAEAEQPRATPAPVDGTPPRPAQSASTAPAATSGPGFDGAYAGPICYGPGPNDRARCYRAEGTVEQGKISAKWPGREPGMNMILSGAVSASGDVTIELHAENADGARMVTIDFQGTLRDGKIDASGSFRNGRPATLSWRRN